MRKRTCLALMAAAAALPDHAIAQVAGHWHVIGDISGHHFDLDCQFDPHDTHLGGTCVEIGSDGHPKNGKVHTLTQGSFNGQQVRWAYPVSMMLMTFDISFDGTLTGNTMAGAIAAAGRKGNFTARRS